MDWKLLSILDVDNIVENGRVDHLQKCLDTITFSDISSTDLKAHTQETTSKLIWIMQLTLEYLLYCQEQQYQLVKEIHAKNSAMKKADMSLKKENAALKEDVKIYQRQLTLLRQSLAKAQQLVVRKDAEGLRTAGGATSNLFSDPEIAGASAVLLESVLMHEKETRNFMQQMLDEQRQTFLKEFSNFRASRSKDNLNVLTPSMDEIRRKIDEMAMEAIANVQANSLKIIESITPTVIAKASTSTNNTTIVNGTGSAVAVAPPQTTSSTKEYDDKSDGEESSHSALTVLQSAAVDLFAAENVKNENMLKDRERVLLSREASWDAERAEWSKERRSYLDKIDQLKEEILKLHLSKQSLENTITAEQGIVTKAWDRCRVVATRSLYVTLNSALFRRQMKSFRRWERNVTLLIQQQRAQEYARHLELATTESASKIQTEKSRALVEAARFSTLTKQIEREKEMAAARRVDTAIMTSMEFDVGKVRRNAETETATETEVDDMEEELKSFGKKKSTSTSTSTSSISTSTSNLPQLLQAEAAPTHPFSSVISKVEVDERLHSHIKLTRNLSETELLQDLDRRIAQQYKPLDEAQVLSNLASELTSRLKKNKDRR